MSLRSRSHARIDVSHHDVQFVDPDTRVSLGTVSNLSTSGMLLRCAEGVGSDAVFRGRLVARDFESSAIRASCKKLDSDGQAHIGFSRIDVEDWIAIRQLLNDAVATPARHVHEARS